MKGWRGESGRHSLAAKGVRSPKKRSGRPVVRTGGVCRGKPRRRITTAQAKAVGDAIGVDWRSIEVEQFRKGMSVELEHGCRDSGTNVTYDDLLTTGKIAHAHLKESSDYYRWLHCMEKKMDEGGPPPKAQIPHVMALGAVAGALKGAKVRVYDWRTGRPLVEYESKSKDDTGG